MAKEMFVQISDCKLYAKLIGENNGKPTIIMDAWIWRLFQGLGFSNWGYFNAL